jgi:hypothetical protein
MGTQSKVCFAVSFAVLLISLATNVSAAANTLDGNTNFPRTVAEFIREGEPLMESEVSRRLLVGTMSPGPLQRGPICNAKIYGNCIVSIGLYHRPCTTYNRCDRNQVRS